MLKNGLDLCADMHIIEDEGSILSMLHKTIICLRKCCFG